MSFICDECPKTFESARAKASHAKVHSKSITCPVCQEKVRYLAVHVKREHGDDPLVRLEAGMTDVIAEVRTLRREVAELRQAGDQAG